MWSGVVVLMRSRGGLETLFYNKYDSDAYMMVDGELAY